MIQRRSPLKRDLKVGPISAYYRKLASDLLPSDNPQDVENRDVLYEAYMKYADQVDSNEEKLLAKYKKRSYNRKHK